MPYSFTKAEHTAQVTTGDSDDPYPDPFDCHHARCGRRPA
jgi:hypothetical protein